MDGKPKISVIFSVYNGATYLREAVESILNQSYSDFEFIIVNDGSTDNTVEILNEYTDSRIVRINNQENIGLARSLNRAIETAQGELIARMDADDISAPDRFKKQVAYLDAEEEVAVLGTCMKQIDAVGNNLGILNVPCSHNLIKWKMLFETSMFHATVMMRKKDLDRVGNYSPDYQHIEDTELWIRMIDNARFSNLNEVLYIRRWHDESVCNLHNSVQFRKGVDIRHNFFENILGKEVPFDIILLFSECLHSFKEYIETKDVKRICSLLIETWSAFIDNNKIVENGAEEIRADLVKRLIFISQKDRRLFPQKTAIGSIKRLIPGQIKAMLNKFASKLN